MSADHNPYGAPGHAPGPVSPAAVPSARSVTIRRVDPVSVGKLSGALYALVGLVGAVVFALVTLAGAVAGGADGMIGGVIGSFVLVLVMPMFYGVMGMIIGLIGALLYNLGAGLVGGIVLDLEA